MIRQAVTVVASIVLAAQGCGGTTGGKEDTSDEVRQQFHRTIYLKFSTTYRARKGNMSCRWRIEAVKKGDDAKPRTVAHGDYGNAKIKVEEPDTVDVYLVYNRACGRWDEL